ncbi:chitin deacetylase-like isoform e [Micractinium conductrix]|uniref:Chitin deacetylase-like isoform e n=1 Tax=Micractinium conductrix TaxID=554055 RepID=A0A2P6VK58_9CHLO|nr:chitin deacetylase-like isoform e [Micractinium conductrix]|eukprot:PSC74458.1 chitin deacetylase-like isoform e [Micractinium conductrix]
MVSRTALAALVLLLGAAAAHGAVTDYSCPSSCKNTLGCVCASTQPPGGIANGDVPQFIVLTNDDAITVISQPMILNITERHSNKNGCKMPATWFVSVDYTDPNLVKQVFVRGHEIATHTVNHLANPNVTQIVGAKKWLAETAGIPADKIQGFRAPFLVFSPEQRDILAENGFGWDSSISEQYPSTISPSAAERVWPYTMDYGIPQNCAVSTGNCSTSERHPGLWEFPMWNVQDATGTVVASMDPQGDPYELYKLQFDQRYSGNRAPLGIYLHAAWLIADPSRADRLNEFLAYAVQQPNTFLVTVSQVLDWMKNPVPASQYSPTCPSAEELLRLLPQGTALCVMPNEGCDYGTFDSSECKCMCQNEEINAAGYCRDAAGRCTVQKDYDFVGKTYFCPSAAAAPAPAGSTPAAGGADAGQTPAVDTAAQPLTVEMDVTGTTPADFTATKADAVCAQLLRLTGDSEATCTVVHAVSVTGRRLLQDKVHVTVEIETKNADATVKALQTDTIYTLLTPTGITVVPGTVKAALGAPVVPTPATDAGAAPAGEVSEPDIRPPAGTTDATSSDGSSNIGLIVGAVCGAVALVAVGVIAFVMVRRRRARAATELHGSMRTSSYNPTFRAPAAGVTATVTTSRSPTKKQLQQMEAAVSESPLRDSMVGMPRQQQQ